MKKIFLLLSLFSLCFAELSIEDFESDLYSRNGGLKKVELNIKIFGDGLSKDYILDSLNMVISSYFYEDLFTEQGKENLKKTLIKYAGKRYSINIDEILIIKLKSKDSAEAIKEILKDANLL